MHAESIKGSFKMSSALCERRMASWTMFLPRLSLRSRRSRALDWLRVSIEHRQSVQITGRSLLRLLAKIRASSWHHLFALYHMRLSSGTAGRHKVSDLGIPLMYDSGLARFVARWHIKLSILVSMDLSTKRFATTANDRISSRH